MGWEIAAAVDTQGDPEVQKHLNTSRDGGGGTVGSLQFPKVWLNK